MSIKVNFLGQTEILDSDNEQIKEIKKKWNHFSCVLFLLLFVKIGLDVFVKNDFFLYLWVSVFCTIISVLLIAYNSFKFSGKKISILNGFLGLVWVGYLGIAAGYLVVKKYADRLEKDINAN